MYVFLSYQCNLLIFINKWHLNIFHLSSVLPQFLLAKFGPRVCRWERVNYPNNSSSTSRSLHKQREKASAYLPCAVCRIHWEAGYENGAMEVLEIESWLHRDVTDDIKIYRWRNPFPHCQRRVTHISIHTHILT